MQPMLDVNVKIVSELRAFLHICNTNSDVLDVVRVSENDFTRNRRLTLVRLVLFICRLGKKTLSVELENFFENELALAESCTVSAFCQQRKKLKPEFFSLWNEVLYSSFYHYADSKECKRWRGFRLFAADGSGVSLICTKALHEHFGGAQNQLSQYCGATAFVQYDLLNKLFVHTELAPYRTAELDMAWRSIERLPEDSICIYDRNFSNFKTIALHRWQETERHFVIRAKESHRVIKQFLKTGLTSQVIDVKPPSKEAISSMWDAGFKITRDTAIQVRLVRVELSNGVTEVLYTNLWEEDGFETELFKDLYNQRWGVETAFGTSKNILQLECMSGQTVTSVYQDFYATIFMTNLLELLSRQADEVPPTKSACKRKRKKWKKKTNKNKAAGCLRKKVVSLILGENLVQLIKEIITYFSKYKLPIRPGRTYPRIRKNKQTLSKHKTYSNFKNAA
jgi:hypothetical protein